MDINLKLYIVISVTHIRYTCAREGTRVMVALMVTHRLCCNQWVNACSVGAHPLSGVLSWQGIAKYQSFRWIQSLQHRYTLQ